MHQAIDSLGALLESRGMATRFFDMGRRIGPIPAGEFRDIEAGRRPYPAPLLRAAWLGILHYDIHEPQSNTIWFLRLPVDEEGMLDPGARDDLLFHLLEDLGRRTDGGQEQAPASDGGQGNNPYGFSPRQEHLAVFHAQAARQLGQPPSRFYGHAREYLGGAQGYEQWAFVGMQGIADVCARLDEDDNQERLVEAMARLPVRPLEAFCQCLEHQAIDGALAGAVIRRIHEPVQDDEPVPALLALAIRAVSGCREADIVRQLVASSLAREHANSPEVLAAIVARAWTVLEDAAIRQAYLLRLAENSAGQEVFNAVISDALGLPGLRGLIQGELRKPERPESLTKAIGGLFSAVRDKA